MSSEYFIYNNHGNIPLKVIIHSEMKICQIFRKDSFGELSSEPVQVIKFKKVYIGKSPVNRLTLKSGCSGSDFNGNSILLQIRKRKYIFIGHQVFEFYSESKIKIFCSPMGRGEIPYPFAITKTNIFFLFRDLIKIKGRSKNIDSNDPYEYYYRMRNLIPENDLPGQCFMGITQFLIGDDVRQLIYSKDNLHIWKLFPDKMKYFVIDNDLVLITKKEFKKVLKAFGKNRGFGKIRGLKYIVLESEPRDSPF